MELLVFSGLSIFSPPDLKYLVYLGTHCVDFWSHWPPQPSSEAACEDGGGDAEPRVLHGHHGPYVVVVECSDQVGGLGQHK